MKRAEVARFYGWTHGEMDGLDMETFNSYFLAIEPLKAAEHLALAHIVSFPHMSKREDQKTFLKKLRDVSESVSEKEKPIGPALSTDDLARLLAGRR
jgi:hypothetical protein